MNQDKLIITVSKKGSDDVVARVFRDGGAIKSIVDNDFELKVDETGSQNLSTKDRLETVLIDWLEEYDDSAYGEQINTIFPQVARVLLDLVNTKDEVPVKFTIGEKPIAEQLKSIVKMFDGEKKKDDPIEPISRINESETLCWPIVEYLRKNHNPHTKVLITDDYATLLTGELGVPFQLKD